MRSFCGENAGSRVFTIFLFTQVFALPLNVSTGKDLQFKGKFLSVRKRYYSIKKNLTGVLVLSLGGRILGLVPLRMPKRR